MNMQLKVTKIGNSAGVGDSLFVSETPDGVRITAANPDFAAKMALAEAIMREDRDILNVLAK
jgi:hypothetical protein